MRRTSARLLSGMAIAVTAVVLSGAPASAHAVLLGTDPPIGGAMPASPSELRLHFSEGVEVRFSGVQVTASDGAQVRTGPLRRAGGGRDLVVPLPSLRTGSYVVGWEALSSDGHPATGQYGFGVGAPSGAPVRLTSLANRKNPNISFLFGQARFAFLAAFMFLVGATAMRRFVWRPAVRAAGAAGSVADTRFERRFATSLPLAWVVLATTGAASLLFESAIVSGRSLWSSLHPAVLTRLLGTTYGRLWMAQMVLILALALPVAALARRPRLAGLRQRHWLAAGAAVSAGLAAVVALNGHAGAARQPVLPVALLTAHLLAAAVWAGGLGALVLLGAPAWRATPGTHRAWRIRPPLVREVLPRFSRLAVVTTALLVLTGVLGTRESLGALANLWRIAYGRMLVVKVVLLAAALVFGARHLLVVPRRLAGADPQVAVASLERSTRAEGLVLAAAVAAAAVLVSALPGRYAQAGARPVDLRQPIGRDNVELVVAPDARGVHQVVLSFVGGNGVLVREASGPTAKLRQPDGAESRVDLQTLSPGSFSAAVSLPTAGAYRLAVTDSKGNSTTFAFRAPKPLRG